MITEGVKRVPDEKNMVSLPWHKWRIEDYRVFRDSLTNEQMGTLFFAIMNTADTGDIIEVPDEIRVAYRLCVQQVLAARTAYSHRCEVNTKNGANGGRKKTENAKAKNTKLDTFIPPSKTGFKKLAKEMRQESGYIYFTGVSVDEFYEELSAANWMIGDVKIESEDALCTALYARFNTRTPRNMSPEIVWRFFTQIFGALGEDFEAFDRAWDMFMYNFSSETGAWVVAGSIYDKPVDAVKAILASVSET